MAIKNIFKARVKPQQAIANFANKFKQNKVTKINTEPPLEKTNSQDLEKDIAKVDRSLKEGVNLAG